MNKLRGLYGITDAALLSDLSRLLEAVEQALQGGMQILQYRAKQLPQAQQLEQAGQLKKLCQQNGAIFIINDDTELALSVGADGVHLGRDDQSIQQARSRLGQQAIIGCSCYNRLDLAQQAQNEGADYVAFGRFFPSQTKPEAAQVQAEILRQARAVLEIPLCAIGGITTMNAAQLIDQGADMVAVIHDLFAARDVFKQAQEFKGLFS